MSGEGLIAEARAVHGDSGMIRLKELMARGTEFLGTEWAILGGAMSWVSERHLVAAISDAGGIGLLACRAKKLVRSGVEALVIEGMEAGGHIGPVSTSVLAQEILPHVAHDVPVFDAGGIGRGEAIAAYLEMGASGVQLGTRFVCAHECIAHPAFKKAFIRASARDAITSVQIDARLPVIPVRALRNREMESFARTQREVAERLDRGEVEMAEAQLQIEQYWAGALRRAVIEGDVETGSVMAGQSVGMVKEEASVADIMTQLIDQAAQALERRSNP